MAFAGWVPWRAAGSISLSVSVTIFSLQKHRWSGLDFWSTCKFHLRLCLFSWVNQQCWNKSIAFLFSEPFAQIATALFPSRTELFNIVLARFLSLLWFCGRGNYLCLLWINKLRALVGSWATKTQRRQSTEELSMGWLGSFWTHLLTSVLSHICQICTVQNRHLQHSKHIWWTSFFIGSNISTIHRKEFTAKTNPTVTISLRPFSFFYFLVSVPSLNPRLPILKALKWKPKWEWWLSDLTEP